MKKRIPGLTKRGRKLGGKNRWVNKSKRARSMYARKIAKLRWAKEKTKAQRAA